MIIYFLSVLLTALLILYIFTRLTANRLIRQHHTQKLDFFAHHPIKAGDIVFIGDSLTDGVRWDELFPGMPVKNRGVNADTTSGVLARLDDVLAGLPAALFILVGTNDLPWYMRLKDDAILFDYEAILKRCNEESPRTRIFAQSLLPRQRRYARRIRALNHRLKGLAAKYEADFIDLFPHFAKYDGAIDPEISNDQLHLLGAGYQRWVQILKPIIENLQQSDNVAYSKQRNIT